MMFSYFLAPPPNASSLLSHSYDFSFILLAVCFASLTVCTLNAVIKQIQHADNQLNRSFWLILGAVVLGNSLFTSQFFSLLAFIPIDNSTYHIPQLITSWLLAILSCGLIIHALVRQHFTYWQYLLMPIMITLALTGMYAICIAATQTNQQLFYSPWLFPITSVINIALISLVIYSKRLVQLIEKAYPQHPLHKIFIPMLVGMTILGLDYNALASSTFAPANSLVTASELQQSSINVIDLSITLVILVLLINFAAITAIYFEKNTDKEKSDDINFNWRGEYKKTFCKITTPLVFLILLASYIIGYFYTHTIQEEARSKSLGNISLASSYALNDLENILTHLYLLKMGAPMKDMLAEDSLSNKKRLAEQFLSIGKILNLYEQIRFIDHQGMEIVRIDAKDRHARIALDSQLQDKSDRNYFRQAIQLEKNEIYVSPLDLNIEQGQVERPYKPVLRIGIPVFDDLEHKRGILILNYRAKIILDSIRGIFTPLKSRVYFLNGQGFFLIGPSEQLEWGFMFDRQDTFEQLFPEVWQPISQQNQGQISSVYGDFTFQKIDLSQALDQQTKHFKSVRSWKVVIHDHPFQWSWHELINHPLALINISVLLLATFIVAWFSTRSIVAKRYAEQVSSDLLRHVNFQKFALDEHAIVSTTDVKGRITYINDKFCEISGYTREELLGKNHRLIKSDEHSIQFYKTMWQSITKGKPWHGEVKNYRKDGSEYWVSATIVPFLNERGKPFKYVSIRTDITQGKKLESELAKALHQANTATQAKTDFLANMSHEIRTPMNAIVGMSLLALQTELEPKQKDYLEKIHNAANTLLSIINNILDFSKIEAGKVEVEELPFHLDEVLNNLSHLISVKVREKDLELLIATDSKVPNELKGDPLRLSQILINLVNNAVKFTEKGEILLRIELLENLNEKITLKFSVMDDGIGMSEEQLGRLFQSFSQADASTTRKYGGTGLGLSISKELTELMGGEIWAESTQNNGSSFIFTAQFQHSEILSKKPSLPAPDLRGLPVLIVDDSPTAREIIQQLSENLSFKTTLAASGEEALELIYNADKSDQPFKLIFMDWKMPGINGVETCQRIKSDSTLQNSPKVIIVSAYDRSQIIKHMSECNIDGFLDKPVSSSALLDAAMVALGYEKQRHKNNPTQNLGIEQVANLHGAHILLVEDNEINQQVAYDLLVMAQLKVTIASNGQEAIEIIQKMPTAFDCVLMDVQMPIMDGYEATKILRQESRFEKLPIIAMTANAMVSDIEKCKVAGMDDHVAKPIDPKNMFAAIARWIPAFIINPSIPTVESNIMIDIPEFNTQQALMRVGGSMSSYRKLLDKVYLSEHDAADRIRHHLAKQDLSEAIRAAHTLKGIAGTIGATQLHVMAGEVEISLENSGTELPIGQLEQLEDSLQQAMQLIKTALDACTMSHTELPINTLSLAEIRKQLNELCEQIENFDSTAEDTLEKILAQIDIKQSNYTFLTQIQHALGEYDFENAQNLLQKGLEHLEKTN